MKGEMMITGNNYHRLQFYNDHVYVEFHKSFVFFFNLKTAQLCATLCDPMD